MEAVAKTAAQTDTGEAAQDDDNSVVSSWFTVDEETAMELSKLLESFGSAPPPVKVKFIDDPYSSAVIFQSSAAYITINGNEESCGSSFADLESSVMASIDRGGGNRILNAGVLETRELLEEENGDWDGYLINGVDYDDEMWVDFLGEDIFGLL